MHIKESLSLPYNMVVTNDLHSENDGEVFLFKKYRFDICIWFSVTRIWFPIFRKLVIRS